MRCVQFGDTKVLLCRRYEPAEALFAGPDGLDALRRLAPAAGASRAAFAAFEVGAGQAAAVQQLLSAAGFPDVDTRNDLAGIGAGDQAPIRFGCGEPSPGVGTVGVRLRIFLEAGLEAG